MLLERVFRVVQVRDRCLRIKAFEGATLVVVKDEYLADKALFVRVDDTPVRRPEFYSRGGFAEHELALLQRRGFLGIRMGPRVLRTETAAGG